MSWSCFGSIEEWVTQDRLIRARSAGAELEAIVRDIRRRAIADRRARFVIGIANDSGFYGKVFRRAGRLTVEELADAGWWNEALTSVDRARLILAAGGLAW